VGAGDGSEATQADDAAAGAAVDGDVDESLVERVRESDPRDVAHELASLRTRIDGLEGELDAKESENEDLAEKLKRKQADFQNFKKRMEKRREDEQQRATADLVTRLLDVRDNLKRALDQDEGTDIRGGVESTLRQFDDELAQENVDVVEPEPGEDVDPHLHEVWSASTPTSPRALSPRFTVRATSWPIWCSGRRRSLSATGTARSSAGSTPVVVSGSFEIRVFRLHGCLKQSSDRCAELPGDSVYLVLEESVTTTDRKPSARWTRADTAALLGFACGACGPVLRPPRLTLSVRQDSTAPQPSSPGRGMNAAPGRVVAERLGRVIRRGRAESGEGVGSQTRAQGGADRREGPRRANGERSDP